PKAKWVGGRRGAGEPLSTSAGVRRGFGGRFARGPTQVLPIVIRETARKHQHTVAEMTVWRHRGA
ncbi:MAG: hypothetical protein ACKON8_03090, partial [Planctomycetota bacterium]